MQLTVAHDFLKHLMQDIQPSISDAIKQIIQDLIQSDV